MSKASEQTWPTVRLQVVVKTQATGNTCGPSCRFLVYDWCKLFGKTLEPGKWDRGVRWVQCQQCRDAEVAE